MKRRNFSVKDNYTKNDFINGVWKDGTNDFSTDEKILMAIKAYLEAGKIINKEKLKFFDTASAFSHAGKVTVLFTAFWFSDNRIAGIYTYLFS